MPVADIPRLKKTPAFHSDPFFATYFISFNTRQAPFDQKDFRRAVAGSIQRDEIVRALDTGEKPAEGSWLPPGIEGYVNHPNENALFASSVAKVKDQLVKHPLSPVAAGFDSGARNSLIMEKIQRDLQQNLGMKLSLTNMDWKSYIKSLQTNPPALYRFGWLTPFADPINPLDAFTTGNPNNYSGWSNAEYDRLVQEIAGMKPGQERTAKIERAQKILVEDEAAVVPIYHYVQDHLVAARVNGFKVNPFGTIFFRDLTIHYKDKPGK
jgi:oligopeptide transport system substrate-binding protein